MSIREASNATGTNKATINGWAKTGRIARSQGQSPSVKGRKATPLVNLDEVRAATEEVRLARANRPNRRITMPMKLTAADKLVLRKSVAAAHASRDRQERFEAETGRGYNAEASRIMSLCDRIQAVTASRDWASAYERERAAEDVAA